MIPIKLTIEGLYSYRTKQSIDFSELTANHLFGIFGSVGSGKSSILEAITFALYGQTDRLNLSGDNRNYNMMNLKSNQLLIEFDFIAGTDNQLYKSVTTAKRNSKRYEDVKKPERVLYKSIDGVMTPISNDELEAAIGLSYDNFKRTIIIPQGKFQEFLQLGSTQRTRMMKDLFNLEKFELAPKVAILQKENDAKLQNTEGQMESLKEISPEQLKTLSSEKESLQEKTKQLETEFDKKQSELLELDKLQQLIAQQSEKKEEQSKLLAQQETFQIREQKLNDYQYCIEHFKSLFENINNQKQRVNELSRTLGQNESDLTKLNADFELIQKEYKSSAEKNEKADSSRKSAEAMSRVAKIKEYQEKISISKERLIKGEPHLKNTIEKIASLEKEESEKINELKKLKNSLPELETITNAQNWFSEQKQINKKIKELSDSENHLKNQEQQLLKELEQFSSKEFLLDNWKAWGIQFNAQKEQLKEQTNKAYKSLNELLVQQKLQNYATHLHEGEACPLCGSKEHPQPIQLVDIDNDINLYNNQLLKIEEDLKELNHKEIDWTKTVNHHQQIEKQLKEIEEKLNTERKKEAEHLGCKPTTFITEEDLSKKLNEVQKTNTQIKVLEETLELFKQELKKQTNNKSKFEEELNKIQNEISNHQKAIELLQEQTDDSSLKEYSQATPSQLIEQSKTILQQIEINKKTFEQAKNKYEDSRLRINTLKTTLEHNKTQFKNETNLLKATEEQLQNQIISSHFNNLEQVTMLLNAPININDERSAIDNYKNQMNLIAATLQKLESDIGNKNYSKETHAQLKTEVETHKKALTENIQLKGKLENQITELKSQLKKKEQLGSSLQKLQERAEDIKTMRRLFSSSGFVNYVSSVYLQNICTAANERFKIMTRQQLSLELNGENNFEVRDYLNEGKTRSVKTLSGGQTFQASLALALALSDNIQSRNQSKQNFFFLDEGFGSLDKQALEMVFSTLKGLRNENRIVGVISHVEELQQEIPNALFIRSNEEKGSTIKCSWEE